LQISQQQQALQQQIGLGMRNLEIQFNLMNERQAEKMKKVKPLGTERKDDCRNDQIGG
jgi:hypothetical protein